jgi:hypothetical protein
MSRIVASPGREREVRLQSGSAARRQIAPCGAWRTQPVINTGTLQG